MGWECVGVIMGGVACGALDTIQTIMVLSCTRHPVAVAIRDDIAGCGGKSVNGWIHHGGMPFWGPLLKVIILGWQRIMKPTSAGGLHRQLIFQHFTMGHASDPSCAWATDYSLVGEIRLPGSVKKRSGPKATLWCLLLGGNGLIFAHCLIS